MRRSGLVGDEELYEFSAGLEREIGYWKIKWERDMDVWAQQNVEGEESTQARIKKLTSALAGLIGADTKEELAIMEATMRVMPGIEADKLAAINAIHALLSELNAGAVATAPRTPL